MTPAEELPYLSVVATGRNDNHGGNLLRRLQIFLNGLIGQARRHGVRVELVLVEWNPPDDRPPLANALQWPSDPGPFEARIITVSPTIHRNYQFSNSLPLYQMIAKNVGIRRSRGEFILATNIDILFSDELMQFVSARQLQRGLMYRVDRHDVDSNVPLEATVEEQLAYCRTHRVRLNAIEGTFALTPSGFRKPGPHDIVSQDAGIFFGAGWYSPEQHFGEIFRWSTSQSEIHVAPSDRKRVLLMEVEPGLGDPAAFDLESVDVDGVTLGGAAVPNRSLLQVPIPPGAGSIRLRVRGEERPALADGRRLEFRALRCEWGEPESSSTGFTIHPAPSRTGARTMLTITGAARFLAEWRRGVNPGRIGVPFSRTILNRLQLRAENHGFSLALGRKPGDTRKTWRPALLHTNACGDFTLAHRDHWFELRGYPEFDLFSMNLDSLFCFMAHYGGAAERILADPMRIYHIEHAAGSGWTPEGGRLLFDRLASQGVPYMESEEVYAWATEMERFRTTMVFNRQNWGLAEFDLPDATMPS